MLLDRSTLASPKPTGVMPPLPTTANLSVWSASWQVLSPLYENVSSLILYCSTVYTYYQLWSSGFNGLTFSSALCKTGLVLIHLARVSGRFWRWTQAAAAPASVKKKPVGHHFKNQRCRYNTCYVHIRSTYLDTYLFYSPVEKPVPLPPPSSVFVSSDPTTILQPVSITHQQRHKDCYWEAVHSSVHSVKAYLLILLALFLLKVNHRCIWVTCVVSFCTHDTM